MISFESAKPLDIWDGGFTLCELIQKSERSRSGCEYHRREVFRKGLDVKAVFTDITRSAKFEDKQTAASYWKRLGAQTPEGKEWNCISDTVSMDPINTHGQWIYWSLIHYSLFSAISTPSETCCTWIQCDRRGHRQMLLVCFEWMIALLYVLDICRKVPCCFFSDIIFCMLDKGLRWIIWSLLVSRIPFWWFGFGFGKKLQTLAFATMLIIVIFSFSYWMHRVAFRWSSCEVLRGVVWYLLWICDWRSV